MKKLITVFALVTLMVVGVTQAETSPDYKPLPSGHDNSPITYLQQLFDGDVVAGNSAYQNISNPGFWDYYSFQGTAGDVLTVDVHRLDDQMDPATTLFFGIADSSAGLSWTGSTQVGMTYLIGADDNDGIAHDAGGSWTDPTIEGYVLPSTGIYTLAVFDFGGGADTGAPGVPYEIHIAGINSSPVAVSQVAVVAYGEVPEIDGGSYDPDGGLITQSQSPAGAFNETGLHYVTLTVTDSAGAMDSCLATVVVYDPSPLTQGPSASGAGIYEIATKIGNFPVQFAASIREDEDGHVHGGGSVAVPSAGYYGNFRALCLEVHGNIALQVHVFESGNGGLFGIGDPETGDLTGWVFATAGQNNGQGADRVGVSWNFSPEEAPENPCQALDELVTDTELTVREFLLAQFSEGFPVQAGYLLKGDLQNLERASNPQARPFRGSVTSVHDDETDYTCDCPDGYSQGGPWGGTGNLTYMGEVSSTVIPCVKFHYDLSLDFPYDAHFEVIGNCGQMFGENGDQLNFDIPPYALAYDVESGSFSATIEITINGGTGRFEAATGEVTQSVVAYLPLPLPGFDNTIIATTTSTFDGYIIF